MYALKDGLVSNRSEILRLLCHCLGGALGSLAHRLSQVHNMSIPAKFILSLSFLLPCSVLLSISTFIR